MNNRPKRVKVGVLNYNVDYVQKVDEDDSLGECDYTGQAIKIKENQPFESERDAMLHEFFHAVDHMQETNLTEKQVNRMATGILMLLRDNPKFVKYLCEKHKVIKG